MGRPEASPGSSVTHRPIPSLEPVSLAQYPIFARHTLFAGLLTTKQFLAVIERPDGQAVAKVAGNRERESVEKFIAFEGAALVAHVSPGVDMAAVVAIAALLDDTPSTHLGGLGWG